MTDVGKKVLTTKNEWGEDDHIELAALMLNCRFCLHHNENLHRHYGTKGKISHILHSGQHFTLLVSENICEKDSKFELSLELEPQSVQDKVDSKENNAFVNCIKDNLKKLSKSSENLTAITEKLERSNSDKDIPNSDKDIPKLVTLKRKETTFEESFRNGDLLGLYAMGKKVLEDKNKEMVESFKTIAEDQKYKDMGL